MLMRIKQTQTYTLKFIDLLVITNEFSLWSLIDVVIKMRHISMTLCTPTPQKNFATFSSKSSKL